MPIHTVQLHPGIDIEKTALLNQLGWSQSQWIRWREGLPEKRGGWSHLNNTPFIGTARGLKIWADLTGIPYAGIGTDQRLQVFTQGVMADITPIAATSNITGPFTVTQGSSIVSVMDASYLPQIGSWIYIQNATYIAGIFLQGYYRILTVAGNIYTFDSGQNATQNATGGATFTFSIPAVSAVVTLTLGTFAFTSGQIITVGITTNINSIQIESGQYTLTVTGGAATFNNEQVSTSADTVSENGGQTRINYLVPSSNLSQGSTVSGYGIGNYGVGLYGVSQSVVVAPSGGSQSPALSQWALDNWGQNLVGNYPMSTFYAWVPPVSPGNVAMPTGGTTPAQINWSFVAMPQQIAVALGATPIGQTFLDPNLVRWSDQSDYTDWVAAVTNQAGSFRIPTGSKIVGGMQGPNFGCIWTDVDFWLMQYLGPPFVFGFTKISHGTELLASRGAGIMNGIVYWVSNDNFFRFDGNSVQVVPCTVWDVFFKNINNTQLAKVFCAPNSHFSEISWYYPSLNSTEVDSYVTVNVVEGTWDYGMLTRTAWTDDNAMGTPVGTDLSGLLQQHDNEGVYDADGNALPSFIQSGFMALSDGTLQVFVERLIPDLILNGGSQRVFITLLVQNYPSDNIYSITLPVTPQTPYLITRMRGRVAAIKILSADVGVFWRLGALRYLAQSAGRR